MWTAYRGCRLRDRLRVLARVLSCPFAPVVAALPPQGRVLDVGCGDGVLGLMLGLADEGAGRTYVGVDPAVEKIAAAKAARIPGAEFHVGDAAGVPARSYDGAAVVDVLYLMPRTSWHVFLENVFRAVRESGLVVIKEVTDRPRWKAALAYAQELVAIRVLKMTRGERPHFEPVGVYQAHIEAAGGAVLRVEDVGRGWPHAHVLFVARPRPADARVR